MEEGNYSLDSLRQFFDRAANNGLMNRNTAQSRKAAANKVLGVLPEDEVGDLREVDLEDAFRRFQNLEGMSYKPDSLQVYQSRLRTAVSEFISFVDAPAQFKPTGNRRGGGKKQAKGNDQRTPDSQEEVSTSLHTTTYGVNARQDCIAVPVPIREGVTVQIQGVPLDLTAGEAGKIAAIIKAYAATEEQK